MLKDKQELTTLTFGGPSFEDHGLELDVLPELVQYKKILLETAEHLWRREHADRARLPKGFKESFLIKFYEIREGSTTIPLVREIESQNDRLPSERMDELNEAVELVEESIAAAGEDRSLPDNFPKNILPLFGDLGRCLGERDYIAVQSPKREKAATFTPLVRERMAGRVEKTYEDIVDMTGEVRAADLDGLNFTIRLANGIKVLGKFEPEHEAEIVEALREHETCRVRFQGYGQFDYRDGSLKKILRLNDIRTIPLDFDGYDKTAKPFWEVIAEITKDIPDEEWAKLPTDASKNLDHYLYGAPKVSE